MSVARVALAGDVVVQAVAVGSWWLRSSCQDIKAQALCD
jgi:hypothetical protein